MFYQPVKQFKRWRCARRYRRLILLSLDEALDVATRAELASHLECCDGCRTLSDRQTFASRVMSLYVVPAAPPGGKPEWIAARTSGVSRPRNLRLFSRPLLASSLAAALLAVALAAVLWRTTPSPEVSWDVLRLAGNPRIGQQPLARSGKFRPGDTLETDGYSSALIQVGLLGQVEIDPYSRVRLLNVEPGDHRLALERGRLHATIIAPPRLFSVETPSATAVDLGCSYTLDVNESGDSVLHVTSGWVALELSGREALVPAGAQCKTKKGIGPGTPYMETASATLRSALERFDFHGGARHEIETVLTESRATDSLSLWHLLARSDGETREKLYERLVSFSPPPAGVTRDGALGLDRQMLDAWREKIEYISIGVEPAAIPVAAGSLKPVGSMIDARFNHTATLLRDGRVLLAGGRERSTNILASAEIFDPETGQFSATGAMTTKRVGHTATLLQNGKVLLTGGSDGDFFIGALASAELYDPATGTFTPAGNMLAPRLAHQATLLKDGRVLVTGGQGEDRPNHNTAELFDPATGSFQPAAKMLERRADHTATLLLDGRVLVTGGGRQSQTDVSDTAEIYDPKRDTFTATGSMSVVRYKHSAVAMPDGKVVILGGSNARMWQGRYVTAEVYDAKTGKFTPTGSMNTARYKIRDAVVLLPGGKILVAGGGTRVEVFDPATGLFATVKGGFATTKYYATATVLQSGEVLIVGGYSFESSGNMPANAVAWIYQVD